MKIKVYLAMPFSLLLLAITVINWPNLLLIILGNSLCALAYLSLVFIMEGEKKRLSGNAQNMKNWQDTVQKAEFSIEQNASNTIPM